MVAERIWLSSPTRWRLLAAAATWPLLVTGFVASALSQHLEFALWGLLAGVGHVAFLRRAAVGGRHAHVVGWLGWSLLAFAVLVAAHRWGLISATARHCRGCTPRRSSLLRPTLPAAPPSSSAGSRC